MAMREFLNAIEPDFKEGGRFERWYAVYEAIDTILYTPGKVTSSSSHVRDSVDLKRVMTTVWLLSLIHIRRCRRAI